MSASIRTTGNDNSQQTIDSLNTDGNLDADENMIEEPEENDDNKKEIKEVVENNNKKHPKNKRKRISTKDNHVVITKRTLEKNINNDEVDGVKRQRTVHKEVLPSFIYTTKDLQYKCAYKLELFGSGCVFDPVMEGVANFYGEWNEEEEFVVGRPLFAKLKLTLDQTEVFNRARISRKHFTLDCVVNEKTGEREFWLTDGSSNGTQVNGEVVGKGNTRQLFDGDKISLLMKLPVPSKETLIGYIFHILEEKKISTEDVPKKPLKEEVESQPSRGETTMAQNAITIPRTSPRGKGFARMLSTAAKLSAQALSLYSAYLLYNYAKESYWPN